MIEYVAQTIVLLFGFAIGALCGYGLYMPNALISNVTNYWSRPGGMQTAVLMRVLIGLNVMAAAAVSRFPTAFLIIGFVSLLAAVGLLLAGRRRVDDIIQRFSGIPAPWVRVWLLFGLCFAGFLIYGVL